MDILDNSLIASLSLGLMGLLISLIYSRRSHDLAHQQMQKQLFVDFNNRYNILNDYLIEIEKNYPTKVEFDKSVNCFLLRQKVNDYFNLCAEEFYWYYHKKRIDKLVWNSWKSGMNYWYNIPTIKELWHEELKANGRFSYYLTDKEEFFTEKK